MDGLNLLTNISKELFNINGKINMISDKGNQSLYGIKSTVNQATGYINGINSSVNDIIKSMDLLNKRIFYYRNPPR